MYWGGAKYPFWMYVGIYTSQCMAYTMTFYIIEFHVVSLNTACRLLLLPTTTAKWPSGHIVHERKIGIRIVIISRLLKKLAIAYYRILLSGWSLSKQSNHFTVRTKLYSTIALYLIDVCYHRPNIKRHRSNRYIERSVRSTLQLQYIMVQRT